MNRTNVVDEIKQDLDAILAGDGEKLVNNAKKFGEHLGHRLSTSQIRNIFSDVKRLEWNDDAVNDLNLLRPKMAYLAGRHGKLNKKTKRLEGPIVDLQEILDEAIKKVVSSKDEKKFENFQHFFEAILAYHRYFGGKE